LELHRSRNWSSGSSWQFASQTSSEDRFGLVWSGLTASALLPTIWPLDSNVKLVVCIVRIGSHYDVLLPTTPKLSKPSTDTPDNILYGIASTLASY
jgi:hypothetical protein